MGVCVPGIQPKNAARLQKKRVGGWVRAMGGHRAGRGTEMFVCMRVCVGKAADVEKMCVCVTHTR